MTCCAAVLLPALAIYVSPCGDDANDGGDRARALRTPQAAVERVRRLRAAGQASGAVEVVLADGTYFLSEALALSASDSGRPEAPVVYRAAHRGKAVLSGGRTLDWQVPSADDALLARIPAEARPHVRVATVPASVGLGSFLGGRAQANGRPAWLYGPAGALPVAAWPDATTNWTDAAREFAITSGRVSRWQVSNKVDRVNTRVPVDTDRLSRWVGEPALWAYGYWAFEWDSAHAPVREVNVRDRLLTIDRKSIDFLPEPRMAYRIENAFSELDRPGEWAVDLATRRLYAWLPSGSVTLSGAEGLIRASGVSNVVFSGFVFTHCRGDAVRFADCRDVRLETCEVREVGGYAATMRACWNCTVEGCDLHHLGEGGIILSGGEVATLKHGGNAALNNHVHHFAQRIPCYRAGISCGRLCGGETYPPSVGNRIEHNLVHHTRHMGIGFQGNEDTIAWNVVHDTCAYTIDAGPIYGYADSDWSTQRGTVIAHNAVHFAGARQWVKMNEAIYLDGIVSGVKVIGNIIVRASIGLFQNGGHANQYVSNVVVACGTAARRNNLGYAISHTKPDSPGWKALQRNRARYHASPWIDRHPELARQSDMADPAFAQCTLFTAHRDNVYAASGKPWYSTHAQSSALCTVTNNLEIKGEPGFVDYRNFDWRLRTDSPAYALVGDLGFEKMGLYDSPKRFSPAVRFGADITPPPWPCQPPLGGPPTARIACVCTGRFPEGVTAFACKPDGCSVPGWSAGRYVDAICNVTTTPDDIVYSFEPTFDCSFKLEVMGGGVPTTYDAVMVDGVDEGPAFSCPMPFQASDRQRKNSRVLKAKKGQRVTVRYRAWMEH